MKSQGTIIAFILFFYFPAQIIVAQDKAKLLYFNAVNDSKSTINLKHLNFDSNASFSDYEFKKDVDFYGSKFNKKADFSHVLFKKQASFKRDTFSTYADFSDLQTGDSTELIFDGAILPDTLDFSHNPKLTNNINLIHCNYKSPQHYDKIKDVYFKKHVINLHATDLWKLKLEYKYFKFDLHGLSYDEKTTIYEGMLKNFKDHGQNESYELLDIDFQQFKNPTFAWVGKLWWNFGYNKEYVFGWAVLFIMIFTIINFFLYNTLNERVYKFDNLPDVPKGKHQHRLWYSFVYTFSIFFQLKLKIDKINFRSKLGTAYLLFMYLLGLVCLAYMANFVLGK